MSGANDLTTALLAADPAARGALLRAAEAGRLEATIAELGRRHEEAAADVLGLVDMVVADRGLRKAARRELHRLRSAGVHTSAVAAPPTADQPALRQTAAVQITQAWATDIDPTGSRALWLLGERRLGGAWLAALLLNDQQGLRELSLLDTTRKRFTRELDERRREDTSWVSLPGEYALRLVREAVDVSRERTTAVPPRYPAFRDIFGEAPGPPERALVHETISPLEASFNPDWLDETSRLLGEPELVGWHVPAPEHLRSRALEVVRGSGSGLLVPGNTPEQQAVHLLDDAAREALTPHARRAFRRRFEETAFVFLQTERLAMARLAVAAARAVDDASLPAERQPLVRVLLAAGLARLIQAEHVGGRRASELLIELVERAGEREHDPGRPVGTRPSGLILPRQA